MTPEVGEVGEGPLAVDEGVGGVAIPDLSGTLTGGLATADGVAAVVDWLEQAAQIPTKSATVAFLIKSSMLWMLNRELGHPLHRASKSRAPKC